MLAENAALVVKTKLAPPATDPKPADVHIQEQAAACRGPQPLSISWAARMQGAQHYRCRGTSAAAIVSVLAPLANHQIHQVRPREIHALDDDSALGPRRTGWHIHQLRLPL